MKNLKTLLVLFVSILAVSFSLTSCNSDGEDYSIPPELQKQYMQQMAGTYSGQAIAHQLNNNRSFTAVDSVRTIWTVNSDSTLTISNFPIHMLDSAINVPSGEITNEATKLRELRTAISELPAEAIRCSYYVPSTMSIMSGGYGFVVNPLCLNSEFYQLKNANKPMFIKKQLTYAGESHTVYFVFYLNYYGGAYSVTAHSFQFDMLLAAIKIDDEPRDYTSSFSTNYFRSIMIRCK